MAIVSSTVLRQDPQADGRSYITERHVADDGASYEYTYLADADLDVQNVLSLRAQRLAAELDRRAREDQAAQLEVPISTRAFMDRFTLQEHAGIKAASATDPVLSALIDYLMGGPTVYLSNPKLASALDYLVQQGLLTAARAVEIRGA